MYKLLLCWRYLRTRYLALACIISVMLGVATLIVVNSVMNGFSTKLRDRLHGLLSDIVIEARSWKASPIPTARWPHPQRSVPRRPDRGDDADHGSLRHAAVFTLANGEMITRPVRLIGIDPKTRDRSAASRNTWSIPENHAQRRPSNYPERASTLPSVLWKDADEHRLR